MDPLSITAAVISIVGNCVKTAKVIRDTQAAYENAPVIIASISSETSVLCLSLSHLQGLLLSRHDMSKLLGERPEFALALDTALTGCTVVFGCLDKEFQKFSSAANPSIKDKARLVWNQDTFRDLLDALRGQQVALNLLLQLSQVDSLAQIKELVVKGQPSFMQAMRKSESLRHSFRDVKVPESVLGIDDSQTIVSYHDDMESAGLEFAFDDLVINSRAYRRAMASAMAGARTNSSHPNHEIENLLLTPKDGGELKTRHDQNMMKVTSELSGIIVPQQRRQNSSLNDKPSDDERPQQTPQEPLNNGLLRRRTPYQKPLVPILAAANEKPSSTEAETLDAAKQPDFQRSKRAVPYSLPIFDIGIKVSCARCQGPFSDGEQRHKFPGGTTSYHIACLQCSVCLNTPTEEIVTHAAGKWGTLCCEHHFMGLLVKRHGNRREDLMRKLTNYQAKFEASGVDMSLLGELICWRVMDVTIDGIWGEEESFQNDTVLVFSKALVTVRRGYIVRNDRLSTLHNCTADRRGGKEVLTISFQGDVSASSVFSVNAAKRARSLKDWASTIKLLHLKAIVDSREATGFQRQLYVEAKSDFFS